MYTVFRISSLCILFKTIKRRLPVHVRLPVVWYPAVQNVKAYGINTLTEKQNYRLELIELITVMDSFSWNWTAWVSCSCVNLLFYVLLWSMVLPCESALMMVISWIGAWNNFASKYVCPTRTQQLATKNPSKTRISVVIFGRQIWDNESSQKHFDKIVHIWQSAQSRAWSIMKRNVNLELWLIHEYNISVDCCTLFSRVESVLSDV
jgi:hypothetical protein